MELYCYHIPPIDFWTGAMTQSQLLKVLISEISDDDNDFTNGWGHIANVCSNLSKLVEQAELAFKSIGWEGDYTGGSHYFSIPSDNQMMFGYIVKQSNNGSCFIASPYELPHIDKLQFEKTIAI